MTSPTPWCRMEILTIKSKSKSIDTKNGLESDTTTKSREICYFVDTTLKFSREKNKRKSIRRSIYSALEALPSHLLADEIVRRCNSRGTLRIEVLKVLMEHNSEGLKANDDDDDTIDFTLSDAFYQVYTAYYNGDFSRWFNSLDEDYRARMYDKHNAQYRIRIENMSEEEREHKRARQLQSYHTRQFALAEKAPMEAQMTLTTMNGTAI